MIKIASRLFIALFLLLVFSSISNAQKSGSVGTSKNVKPASHTQVSRPSVNSGSNRTQVSRPNSGVSKNGPTATQKSASEARPKPFSANVQPTARPEMKETQTSAAAPATSVSTVKTEESAPVPFAQVNGASNPSTYKILWNVKKYQNCRELQKQKRHKCYEDIDLVNETEDTLDFYFAYLTPLQLPSIPTDALPSISNTGYVPLIFLPPHTSTKLRGSCSGGLQYEAVSRRSRPSTGTSWRPRFLTRGTLRMSSLRKEIKITEADNKEH